MSELVVSVELAVRERLGAPAYEHSVRVAQTASALALLYGEDPESAFLAGLLHDWDREVSGGDLVDAARTRGLECTAVDRAVPYLLHAKTGAIAVRERFPEVSDEIAEAVACHTIGAAQMHGLAMVVYLADMIEPAREFEGVDALREAVGNIGLEELFALGYQQSVAHLVRERRWIHPDTVVVWNAHVAREKR